MTWKLSFVLLLCGCGSSTDGPPTGPVGAASFELSEVNSAALDPTPFIAEKLGITLAQTCSGISLSGDNCTRTLTLEANQGTRRVLVSQLRYDVRVGMPFEETATAESTLNPTFQLQQLASGDMLSWVYGGSKAPTGITRDVADTGQVTYRFDHVLTHHNKNSAQTVVLTGSIVLDGCTPLGAGKAKCYPRGGEARR